MFSADAYLPLLTERREVEGRQSPFIFSCKDINIFLSPPPPMLTNVLFKPTDFQTWKKKIEEVRGNLKRKEKVIAKSRQNALCMLKVEKLIEGKVGTRIKQPLKPFHYWCIR